MRARCRWEVVALLIAAIGTAYGEGKGAGALAAHPLVLASEDEEQFADELQAALTAALDRYVRDNIPVEQVRNQLSAQSQGVCDPSAAATTCLAELARGTGARRALRVRLSLWPLVILGEMVGADGHVVSLPVKNVKTTDAQRVQAAKSALAEYVLEHVASLPLAELKPPQPSAAAKPQRLSPLASLQSAAAPARSALHPLHRSVGIGLAATGGAALVGAGIFHLRVADSFSEERDLRSQAPLTPEQRDRVAELQSRALTAQRFRAVGVGVGLVGLGTGAYLLLTPSSSSGVEPTALAVGVGLKQVLILGHFP